MARFFFGYHYKGLQGITACGYKYKHIPFGAAFGKRDDISYDNDITYYKKGNAAAVMQEDKSPTYDVTKDSEGKNCEVAMQIDGERYIRCSIDVIGKDTQSAVDLMRDIVLKTREACKYTKDTHDIPKEKLRKDDYRLMFIKYRLDPLIEKVNALSWLE